MENNIRQNYLKENWKPYPSVKPGILTPLEFKQKVARMVLGQWKPKESHGYLAGRFFQSSPISSQELKSSDKDISPKYFQLHAADESCSFVIPIENKSLGKLKPIDGEYAPDSVLKNGDHVLIQFQWDKVFLTGGLSPEFDYTIAEEITLLSPAFEDYEMKDWSYKRSRQWAHFIRLIRKVFDTLGFTEVRTPTLVESPGVEEHIDFFKVESHLGSKKREFYLPTSPEFHLKKLLSLGWTHIYEFKECFRDNEHSNLHQPEFLMLEWYRAYAPLSQIVKDLQSILNYLKLRWPENISSIKPIEVKTVADLFKEKLNFNLTAQTSLEELRELCKNSSISTDENDSFNDLFHRIWIEKIEKDLTKEPLVIQKYPPSLCSLSKIDNEGWADRLEFYWKGLEIANAYNELNDPAEQKRRFKATQKLQAQKRKNVSPVDEDLDKAMLSGLPPSCGIALGVERLFMALLNLDDLSQARAFHLENTHWQEKK